MLEDLIFHVYVYAYELFVRVTTREKERSKKYNHANRKEIKCETKSLSVCATRKIMIAACP